MAFQQTTIAKLRTLFQINCVEKPIIAQQNFAIIIAKGGNIAQRVQTIILQLIKPLSQIPIKKKSFLEPLLEAITFLFTINSIQLELILNRLLYNFARFFKINILFQIAATSKTRILERNKSRLFTVGGREDLLKLVSTALIIVGFFLMAAR